VADIPDAVKRETYIDFLSRKFDIRRDALEERVSATRAKRITAERSRSRYSPVYSGNDGSSGERLPGEGAKRSETDEPSLPTPKPIEGAALSPVEGLPALETNRIMAKAERDLLNFILTYGTTVLEFQSDSDFYSDNEEDRETVFEFIDNALADDGAGFANAAYKATYEAYSKEYFDGYSQNEIVKHLLDGADRTVAYVAAQLSTDEQYDLSIKNLRDAMMSKGSWLTKFVPKAILVFQTCRLEDKGYSLKEQLNQAQAVSDSDRELAIMQEMINVRKALKAVKVRLGREK
jgi:hypothetical protein